MLQKTLDKNSYQFNCFIRQLVDLQREFNLHLTTEINVLLESLSMCVLVLRQFASRSQRFLVKDGGEKSYNLWSKVGIKIGSVDQPISFNKTS